MEPGASAMEKPERIKTSKKRTDIFFMTPILHKYTIPKEILNVFDHLHEINNKLISFTGTNKSESP
jgi:hypothetical protein